MSERRDIAKRQNDIVGLAADFVTKVFFIDFLKGLSVTLKYLFSKTVTEKYPDDEKWIPFKRFRGLHTLNRNAEGKELCVACELCVKACPTNCITVVPEEDSTGRGIADRVPKIWTVNLVRCLYCGYCEDACPTTAVRLGRQYELACTNFACTIMNKEELLRPDPIPSDFKGGVIVEARLEKDEKGNIVVRPRLWKQKDWWPLDV